ncbi:MAG: hypothetical protein AAFR93_03860 [Pseudomonadota bacterium]
MPMGQAFAYASDVARYQTFARSRETVLERSQSGPLLEGEVWRLHRRGNWVDVVLADYQPPTGLGFEGAIMGVQVTLGLAIEARGDARSALTVDLEVRPTTLASRLILAPALLARATSGNRFESAVKQLARTWERDYWAALGDDGP